MGVVFNKLVRDKIPEIILRNNKTPLTHVASDTEYKSKLLEKLHEEVAEYVNSGDVEELADVLEVIHALAEIHGLSVDDIHKVQQQKKNERGAFTKKIILDKVEH